MRVFPALLFGGLMIVPFAVVVVGTLGPRTTIRHALVTAAFVSLALLGLIGLGSVSFAGGFGIPPFLRAVGGVAAGVALAGTLAWLMSARYRRTSHR